MRSDMQQGVALSARVCDEHDAFPSHESQRALIAVFERPMPAAVHILRSRILLPIQGPDYYTP